MIPFGKKFNSRKEKAVGKDYLGIEIARLYIKARTLMCTQPRRLHRSSTAARDK